MHKDNTIHNHSDQHLLELEEEDKWTDSDYRFHFRGQVEGLGNRLVGEGNVLGQLTSSKIGSGQISSTQVGLGEVAS